MAERYKYSTYGQSMVRFELNGLEYEAYRETPTGGIHMLTRREINDAEFEKAHAIAQKAFDAMDTALRHSMKELGQG